MTKQEQEKKKRGLCRQIFKWIGLGLLTILLIAALVFQAPWKVITLLLIIILACTVLPKPARKWFWAGVGVAVIALIIWVFLPEDDTDWRPYTFDEELAALEAKRAIPDEENAAIIYNQLLGKYNLDVCPIDPNADVQLLLPVREPWKSNEHPRLARWLQEKEHEIDKLLEVSKIEKCRFPIDADILTSTQWMVRLGKVRQWACWLVTMANNDRAEGRADEALEKEIAVLRMAEHQYQQPTMTDMLVGFAIESLGIQQLKKFIVTGDTAEDDLTKIEIALGQAGYHWGPDWQKILDFEKLYAKNMLCGMVYEADSEGKTRLTRRSFASTIGQSPQQLTTGTYSRRKCAKLGVIFVWLYVPSAPEKISEMVDASYEKYYAMTEPGFDWDKEPVEFRPRWKVNYRSGIELLANLPEQAYYRVHEIYLRDLELRRGSRLLTAIKQYKIEHGSWPRSLDEIKPEAPAEAFIDPVSENEFEYENHGKRFSLYGETTNIWPK